MCLPVWRELKQLPLLCGVRSFQYRLHVPSRLEGIETEFLRLLSGTLVTSLHVPSRLEGIETKLSVPNICSEIASTCAFPFGGN